jgi:Domain of unknown function (DUF5069)
MPSGADRRTRVLPVRFTLDSSIPSIPRQAAEVIDRTRISLKNFSMTDIIYPRSPRETMCGWMHLPRYIDKIRLHLAGKLHKDYQDNLGKGFDARWLEAAGLTHEQFVEIVKGTIIDGQVADWVLKNVKKPEAVKAAHRERMLNSPKPGDEAMEARLKLRKEQAGFAHRDDIKCFVDFIDADEKRILCP